LACESDSQLDDSRSVRDNRGIVNRERKRERERERERKREREREREAGLREVRRIRDNKKKDTT